MLLERIRFRVFLAVALWASYATLKAEETLQIVIKTDVGQIAAELYPERAPITVANFVDNINLGLYSGGHFYRAVRADNYHHSGVKALSLIQGGRNETKPARQPIPHETTAVSGLSHTNGILSMARSDPGTADTEFFICIGDNSRLDFSDSDAQGHVTPGYAAFGKVTGGMDIVRRIQASPTGNRQLNVKRKTEVSDWLLPQLMNESIFIYGIEIEAISKIHSQ